MAISKCMNVLIVDDCKVMPHIMRNLRPSARRWQPLKRIVVFCLLGVIAHGQARADVVPSIQVGNHPTFGRIAFDFPARVSFETAVEGDKVVVSFTGSVAVPSSQAMPRNVLSLVGHANKADIAIVPGARIRATRAGRRVILDVLDPLPVRVPPARPTASSPAKPGRGGAKASTVQAGAPRQPVASQLEATPATVPPASPPLPSSLHRAEAGRTEAAPQPQPAAALPAAMPGPVSIAATLASADESAMLAPFQAGVGAAAFRRGSGGVVVFDERRPIDLGQLRNDPVFAQASVQLLPTATLLRVPLAPGASLSLRREPNGWRIQAALHPGGKPLTPRLAAAGMELSVADAGQVVIVPDDDGGQALLVGTLNLASGTGAGVAAQRRTPEFSIAATWLGVVVEPLADRLKLQAGKDGFTLATSGGTLAASPADIGTLVDAAALTRRFDFPALDSDTLLRRMQAQLLDASAAPPRARLQKRLAAAQTMIALGLGVEAHALLTQAQADEPQAENLDTGGLSAIAAMLYGRLDETSGLDDPSLTGTDEIALWRAARDASLNETAPAAADVMASTLPLILSYPPALRSRLLPLAAEAIASSGPAQPIDDLLAAYPDDPALSFARALRLQALGQTDAALALYDGIAAGRDRLLRARAGARATELRLDLGRFTPATAADALEAQVLAWRGDARERSTRMRVAELRTKAGAWRRALDGLREADALFPDHRAAIWPRITDVFLAMLEPESKQMIEPLELVSLTADFAEYVPSGPSGEALASMLADKLIALDLPQRAGPVLDRLMRVAPSGATRAALGARLASLRLEEGDPLSAVAALTASNAPNLPAAVLETRVLTLARARATQGDLPAALATLAAIDAAAADDLRAELLGAVGDWRGALLALAALADKVVPTEGALTDGQRHILLRQAGAAAQVGDATRLRALREREGVRMGEGARGDLFRLLTNEPIRGVGDLARASDEMALARAAPGRVQGL